MGSLRGSKLRSFLTLLGIILATTTLIAVMSVIHGMDVYIAQNVSDMGADGFRILRMAFIGNFDAKKYMEMVKKNPELRPEEYEFLRSRVRLSKEVGMQVFKRVAAVAGPDRLEDVRLRAVSPNIASMTNVQLASGRMFTPMENDRRMYVALIGNDLKETFFPNVDAVGKIVKLDGRNWEVVGVAKKQGSAFGQSLDNFVMVPIETGFKIYGSRQGLSYMAQAIDQSYLFQAQDEIRMLLRAWRHMRPGQEDNFAIVSSDSLVNAWGQMTGAIAATAVAVVSVFMVVGGVVIMNIMLAVVTERTHEIGIRKSVGARRRDILYQFLVESATLAATGGLAGVILAWIVGVLVRSFTPIPMAMPVSAVVVGVTLSAAVGLFFGIYPAQRASSLDPIEALRFER
ncbi:MAG: ABC transporter permease [Acidimicrobiia bacterium]|nr:ABC transporter permease [Acidimicrobiia bacterium]